jgi:hypothetical protein
MLNMPFPAGRTFQKKARPMGRAGWRTSRSRYFYLAPAGPPLFVCVHDSDCCIYWIPLSTLNQVKRMHTRLKRLLHPSKQKGRNRS